jgi:pyruvate carboxylase subunit B
MKIFADIKNITLNFEQQDLNGRSILKTDNEEQHFSFLNLGNNRYSLIHNNKSHLIHIIREGAYYHVHIDGDYFAVRIEDERMRNLRQLVQQASHSSGKQTMVAPIPGLITKINVKQGDIIKKGDGLVILEAMKMENEIKANRDGKVERVLINQGVTVEKDQALIVIQP